jgi:hypothetical protein
MHTRTALRDCQSDKLVVGVVCAPQLLPVLALQLLQLALQQQELALTSRHPQTEQQ